MFNNKNPNAPWRLFETRSTVPVLWRGLAKCDYGRLAWLTHEQTNGRPSIWIGVNVFRPQSLFITLSVSTKKHYFKNSLIPSINLGISEVLKLVSRRRGWIFSCNPKAKIYPFSSACRNIIKHTRQWKYLVIKAYTNGGDCGLCYRWKWLPISQLNTNVPGNTVY